ncbi:MAG: hypothetical protein RL301_456 [Actinomycetota bacterium]
MKICVTGGAGYIGAVAVRKLFEAGHEVNVFDDLSTGYKSNVPNYANFFEGSLLNPKEIAPALTGVDAVIHFAGKSLVAESVANPDIYREINIDGSKNLFNEMKIAGISKIVFSSSAAVYGEPLETPIRESHPTNPTNPYGETKLAVENLIKEYGFNSISFRYFNVAGSYKDVFENHHPETHLIPNILKADPKNPISIYGTDWPTPDRTCIRDYVHVSDIVDAHILAIEKISKFKAEILNLGSGIGFSVKEVISACEKQLGRPIPTVEIGRRSGDPAILLADISKAKDLFNWQPKKTIAEMFN